MLKQLKEISFRQLYLYISHSPVQLQYLQNHISIDILFETNVKFNNTGTLFK